MSDTRSAKAARVYAFGVINKLVQILCPFVIRSIIIYKLGADYLGLSSLFTSVLSILSVSELGIGSAITFCLYKPVAENDTETVNALMGLMKKLYRYIGIFILTVGLVVMPFSGYFIKGSYPNDINLYLLYAVYLLNSVASYFGFAYKRTLLDVYQEGYINHNIATVIDITKYILQIVVLLLFSNYYIYAILLPIATICTTIVTEIVSKKKHPDIVPQGKVSKEISKTIKSKVAFLALHSISSKITTSIDNIVISGAMGLVAVATYGNYQYIESAVFVFVSMAYDALSPAIGNYFYSENNENNFFVYKSLKLISAWISMWCSICLLCMLQPFIKMWVGEKHMLGFPALIMIVLYFYSNVIRQFYSCTYISVCGLWNKTLARQIIASVMNLVLDLLLVKQFGIAGIIFASFFTNALVALPLDAYVTYKYVLKQKIMYAIFELIRDFIVFAIIATGTYLICGLVPMDGIYAIVARFAICLVIPNGIMLLLYRRTEQFKYIKDHLLGMLKRVNE